MQKNLIKKKFFFSILEFCIRENTTTYYVINESLANAQAVCTVRNTF